MLPPALISTTLQDELFPVPLIVLFFGTLLIIFKFPTIAFLHVVKPIKVSFFLILKLVVIAEVSIKCVPVAAASVRLVT